MVLFSLLGLGVQYFFRVEVALALGILVGFVAANFVPMDTACGIRGKQPDDAEEHEPAGRG